MGISFDIVGSKVKDAVSLSNYGVTALPAGVSTDNLKATLSDNSSGVIMLRYTLDSLKLYSGFEYILFQNPSDAYPQGFTSLGGYTVLPGAVNSTAYSVVDPRKADLNRAVSSTRGGKSGCDPIPSTTKLAMVVPH